MQLFQQLLDRFPGHMDHHHIPGRLDGRSLMHGHFSRAGLLCAAFHHQVGELRGYAYPYLNDHYGHSSVFSGSAIRRRHQPSFPAGP
ncbi:hypothetical protein D9M72_454350 [compost metagenome]